MSNRLNYVSIGLSIIALLASIRSCELTSEVPHYQTLSNALSVYSEAYQNFDNALRRPHLTRVFGPDPAARIAAANEADFNSFYEKAQPTLDAYDAYVSAVNRVREPWSPTINEQLMNAGTAAREAVACYLTLQMWVEKSKELDFRTVKQIALRYCRDPDAFRSAFEERSNETVASMLPTVRKML